MKLKTTLVFFAAAVLLITSAACSNSGTTPTGGNPTTTIGHGLNDIAPVFRLEDLDGNMVSLADYRGSPVMVHFWRID